MPMHRTDQLSDREVQIIALAAHGRANSEIARELCLSPESVKKYVSSAMVKLGARNRTDAAVVALRLGLIT